MVYMSSDAKVQFSLIQMPILLNLEPDLNLEKMVSRTVNWNQQNLFEQVLQRFKKVGTSSNFCVRMANKFFESNLLKVNT